MGRPDLINILLSKIPPRKHLIGKRVLSFMQNDQGVMVRVADGSTYHGDILVGADGAYSSIRQSLFKDLAKINNLPKDDSLPLDYDYDCVVGIAENLNPEIYPVLNEDESSSITVLSDS